MHALPEKVHALVRHEPYNSPEEGGDRRQLKRSPSQFFKLFLLIRTEILRWRKALLYSRQQPSSNDEAETLLDGSGEPAGGKVGKLSAVHIIRFQLSGEVDSGRRTSTYYIHCHSEITCQNAQKYCP